MAIPAKHFSYTFADYLTWDSGQRIELIDGEALLMAPPSTAHQLISMELARQLPTFWRASGAKSFPHPLPSGSSSRRTSARGSADGGGTRPFGGVRQRQAGQPRLQGRARPGGGGLVSLHPAARPPRQAEPLPAAGVREYWLVSPEERTVQVLLLQNGLLLPHELYGVQDVAKVNILDGCFIELNKVFGA